MKKYLLFAFLCMLASQANASTQDLLNSIKQKDVAQLTKLLAAGEDVNGRNEQGNTALHYAVAMDNAELTKILLANGADMNALNDKGWSPVKIAETKQTKNVLPLLNQVQEKAKDTTAEATEVKQKVERKSEQEVQKANQIAKQEVQKVNQIAEQETQKVAVAAEQMIPLSEAQAVIKQREEVAQDALQAKMKAEEKIKVLEAKIQKLEKDAATKTAAKQMVKASTQSVAKKSVATSTQSVAKKPVATKAQAPVKKMPPQKSKISDKIFAGDEDIVYCLNYLGQGENQHFLQAAGYFAASAGISEKRYGEIAEISNDYFAHTTEEGLKVRNDECSQIITPKNKEKMNQIVYSINKSLGL